MLVAVVSGSCSDRDRDPSPSGPACGKSHSLLNWLPTALVAMAVSLDIPQLKGSSTRTTHHTYAFIWRQSWSNAKQFDRDKWQLFWVE